MVREMILQRKSSQEITKAVKAAGKLRTLKDDAASKILKGITSLEEGFSAVVA